MGVSLVQSLSRVWLFCDPMDYSPSGSTVHGISQARILAGVVISFSRVSSWLGSNLCLLHPRWILYHWATWEVPCVYIKVYKNGRKHQNKNIIKGFLLHALIQCLLNPYFVAGIVVDIGLYRWKETVSAFKELKIWLGRECDIIL